MISSGWQGLCVGCIRLRLLCSCDQEGWNSFIFSLPMDGNVMVERLADRAAGVHGRADELARIESFLDDVISGPVALLLEGAAGIGKTTLWSAGIDLARRRGCWVLTCRPVQSEAALSFSALGDLLESVPEQALAGLPGPQRQALDVALLRAEPGPEPPDH